MTRFAFFGPSEKNDTAPGGFCVSVFALLSRGDRLLVVKPNDHPRWREEWTPNWRIYDAGQLERELASWRLPSTYVKEGEDPRQALDRVMIDQLGIKSYFVDSSSLENFYDESRRYPGRMHWDYCFVFRVSTTEEVAEKRQPWLADARYLKPSEVGSPLGSAQDALISRLRLA